MPYQYALEQQDYTDYAGGRVFYSQPGHPAFPIRLASEMFQRCLAQRASHAPVTLYDPCCGGAYHLSTLAYLHWETIDHIIASDIDADALALAKRNLNLLTPTGIAERIHEIRSMLSAYGKASHAQALASAERLQKRLTMLHTRHPISITTFQANVLNPAALHHALKAASIDILLTDVPYGDHSVWQSAQSSTKPPLWQMLESLRPVLTTGAIVAIASDKGQRATHRAYRRAGRFQIGKRRIVLLHPRQL